MKLSEMVALAKQLSFDELVTFCEVITQMANTINNTRRQEVASYLHETLENSGGTTNASK